MPLEDVSVSHRASCVPHLCDLRVDCAGIPHPVCGRHEGMRLSLSTQSWSSPHCCGLIICYLLHSRTFPIGPHFQQPLHKSCRAPMTPVSPSATVHRWFPSMPLADPREAGLGQWFGCYARMMCCFRTEVL